MTLNIMLSQHTHPHAHTHLRTHTYTHLLCDRNKLLAPCRPIWWEEFAWTNNHIYMYQLMKAFSQAPLWARRGTFPHVTLSETQNVVALWLSFFPPHIHPAVILFSARGGSPSQLIKSDAYRRGTAKTWQWRNGFIFLNKRIMIIILSHVVNG